MSTPAKAPDPGARAGAGAIGLSEPNVGGREWDYIKECLDTGWVSSLGAFVDRFEREFATAAGAKHAVAMSSGTSALHIALLVAGIRPGDEVVVPALTFIAPVNAVRYAGAWPAIMDVEPQAWQMSVPVLADFLGCRCEATPGGLVNRATGRVVRAIVPVDILGHPCDLEAVLELAARYGLTVVEDATESLGARVRERRLGSISPISCFSFNGNKLITTGGGGMLVTDDAALARRARYLATQAKDDPLEYVHHAVGYNYRLTNIQAAMGCAQLERLDEFLQRKAAIARRYTEALADVPGITPMAEQPWARSAWWLYTVRIDAGRFGMDSRALLRALAGDGIQTRPLWQPMHLSPAHAGAFATACPVAELIHREALSLPCSTGLTDHDQQRVIAAIRRHAARPT